MEPLAPGARVTVAGYSGVAWSIQGPEKVWDPIVAILADDEGNEWEEDTGEGEWVPGDGSRVVAIMVGDDRPFTFDREDCTRIAEDDYCHECGQVGCRGDGWPRGEGE